MSKKKQRKQPKRAAARPKPRARKAVPAANNSVAKKFQQALELAMRGYLFDAVKAFERVARDDKGGDFADDALFNAGLCYLRMNLFHDAIAYFSRVIQGYPDATIAATPGNREHGRTAAKALLGRVRSSLALGDVKSARKDLESLKPYTDSYVQDDEGHKKTFFDLASEALAVAVK